MTKNSRIRRQTLRNRAADNRLTASLRKGRSLATHFIAAGVSPEAAAGAANGLRTVAKRTGVEPVKVARTHRTSGGRADRLRKVGHYTTDQVAQLARSYKPRKAEYKAAMVLLIAAQGAPVTVRQTVRPVRELINA